MGKYIKLFETTSQYNAYTADTSTFIKPNVSLCKDTPNEVHYNPWVETRVVAKYNVTSTSNPTLIGCDEYISGFSEIEIDGVVQPSVVSAYTFSTTGKHTIKYALTNNTNIDTQAFNRCSNMTSVVIPDNVTRIGNYAFNNCSGLTSVTLGCGVITINNYAFYNCKSLTSVDIPNSVTSIGDSVFFNCVSLTSCTIGSGVTNIKYSAFQNCSGLTSIVIPDSVTSMGSNIFRDCYGLTSATIGNGVRIIGNSFFDGCSGLTSIHIPSGITYIDVMALKGCSSLSSITVDSNNTVYDSRNNCNALIETNTNKLMYGCKNTIIPNSVTSIDTQAFYRCTGLTSVTIGSGVTSIGNYAFAYCNNLTSITCNATTAPTIQSFTFRDIHNNGTLTVPSGSSGYNTWMGTGNYYLGKYNWTKVEQ